MSQAKSKSILTQRPYEPSPLTWPMALCPPPPHLAHGHMPPLPPHLAHGRMPPSPSPGPWPYVPSPLTWPMALCPLPPHLEVHHLRIQVTVEFESQVGKVKHFDLIAGRSGRGVRGGG